MYFLSLAFWWKVMMQRLGNIWALAPGNKHRKHYCRKQKKINVNTKFYKKSCDRGVSCNRCVWEAGWCGYSTTVWVTMAWFWHFLNQHGTWAADSEGIRPETDTGNGWEAINWVSTWWGIVGRGSGSKLSQTQSHPLSESGCFLSNRSQYRLNIARTLNKDQKKSTRASIEKGGKRKTGWDRKKTSHFCSKEENTILCI